MIWPVDLYKTATKWLKTIKFYSTMTKVDYTLNLKLNKTVSTLCRPDIKNTHI